MSVSLHIGSIYDAIEALDAAVDRLEWADNGRYRERARDARITVQRARAEYRMLSEKMPRLRSLLSEADRSYDAYVTRSRKPDAEGCSCHINPPCGFCTRETEEEDA